MKSELMDSWILNNLYNSYGYISSQTLRVLQASKFDISLLSFLILLPSVEASPAQQTLLWNYMVDHGWKQPADEPLDQLSFEMVAHEGPLAKGTESVLTIHSDIIYVKTTSRSGYFP